MADQEVNIFTVMIFSHDLVSGLLCHCVVETTTKKTMTRFELWIFLSIFVQMKKYFRWKFGRIISFFPHINKVIRPFLQKLSSKIYFFTFLKSRKKCTLTPIFGLSKKRLYEFSCFFGFQVKYSIAIFSAIQNSIWTFFDESREFSKMFISAFFDDFFSTFFSILCI